MRNVASIFCLIIVLMAPITANAERMPERTLSPEQMYLGGLTCGQTRDQVERIYGEPTTSTSNEYQYGNSFIITFEQYKDAKRIWRIVTKSNNGIATPAGIRVGTSEQVLRKIYGNPSGVISPSAQNNYCAIYFYRGYGESCIKEFLFSVRDNEIEEIQLSVYD